MEFDLNEDGGIGEKRVIWGKCADLGRGGLSYSASFPVVWER